MIPRVFPYFKLFFFLLLNRHKGTLKVFVVAKVQKLSGQRIGKEEDEGLIHTLGT